MSLVKLALPIILCITIVAVFIEFISSIDNTLSEMDE